MKKEVMNAFLLKQTSQTVMLKIVRKHNCRSSLNTCTSIDSSWQLYALYLFVLSFSATPHSLEVSSKPKGKYSDQYTLRWTVVSYPQLVEFDLLIVQVRLEQCGFL